jgi:hypothetical protein
MLTQAAAFLTAFLTAIPGAHQAVSPCTVPLTTAGSRPDLPARCDSHRPAPGAHIVPAARLLGAQIAPICAFAR